MKRYESKPNRTSRGLRLKAAGILCCLAVLAGCGNETLPAAAAKGTRTEWTASAEPEAAVDERTVLFEDTEEGLKAELASGKGQVIVTAGEAFGDGLIQLLCPDGMRIPCPFTASGREVVLSLPGEGGTFRLDILKRTENTRKYAYVCSSSFDAGETDGYTPFLLPSYYVNWSSDGPVANKAAELAAESSSDLEFAGKVYDDIISSYQYDEYAASETHADYVPDPDAFSGESAGIAYDLASEMAALLRAGGVPARLSVGYSGDTLHVWVSAYLTKAGTVSEVIHSPGREWVLIDPVLGTANSPKDIQKYIRDRSNYVLLYNY